VSPSASWGPLRAATPTADAVRAADAAAREAAARVAAQVTGGGAATDAVLTALRETYLRGVREGAAALDRTATHATDLPRALAAALGLADPTSEQTAALVGVIRAERCRVIEACAVAVEQSGALSGLQQMGRIASDAADAVRHLKRRA
jgi:hypothetical protein